MFKFKCVARQDTWRRTAERVPAGPGPPQGMQPPNATALTAMLQLFLFPAAVLMSDNMISSTGDTCRSLIVPRHSELQVEHLVTLKHYYVKFIEAFLLILGFECKFCTQTLDIEATNR